jgi:hypothetical protein
VSVGQRRRRPGWAPRRWDAGSPRTSARASGRAGVAISTLAAASVGRRCRRSHRVSLTSHGVIGTHAMTWAWSHSWCELESTSVPAARGISRAGDSNQFQAVITPSMGSGSKSGASSSPELPYRRELGGPQGVRSIAEPTMKPYALMSTVSPSRRRFQRLR